MNEFIHVTDIVINQKKEIERLRGIINEARDMLERMGVAGAQSFSAGDLVELANLISERKRLRDKYEKNRLGPYDLSHIPDNAEVTYAEVVRWKIDEEKP